MPPSGFLKWRGIAMFLLLSLGLATHAATCEGFSRRTSGKKRREGSGDAGPRRTLLQFDVSDETPKLRLSHEQVELKMVERESRGDDSMDQASPQEQPRFTAAAREQAVMMKALDALQDLPAFNLSSPITRQYARIVHDTLAGWRGLPGLRSGFANGKGLISPVIIEAMAQEAGFMSCCGHVKIIKGRVFFRYGGFVVHWYRLRRFIFTVKTIEAAIKMFRLHSLTAEFIINNCDLPISRDSSDAGFRGGYPVLSTEFKPGSLDIIYPDPLDLSTSYITESDQPLPWGQKKPVAFFRGASTNYDLHNDTNWRANPRFRLHKMSDLRPDLLDAKLMRWSHAKLESTIAGMQLDGFQLAKEIDRNELTKYKYELVVDGGGGSCRTCGVLASDRVMIRQASAYNEFFEPLLKPYVHYIPTQHHFDDLFDQIEWAQANDNVVQRIRREANAVARWACTWEGRALYWAVLLVKYAREAMEDSSAVTPPTQLCKHSLSMESMMPTLKPTEETVAPGWPPKCRSPNLDSVAQPPCTFFCTTGKQNVRPQHWMSSDMLRDINI